MVLTCEHDGLFGGHMKLNKTNVEALPIPARGAKIYGDWEDVPGGFGVRVTASGARSYVMNRRVNGVMKLVTLGRHGDVTATIAKTKAMEESLLMHQGTTSRERKKERKKAAITLRDVMEDYVRNRRTSKGGALTAKSIRDIERHIKCNFSDWADKAITKITTEMVRERFEDISKRSEAQANQSMRVLRALINFSIDEENPRPNPVQVLSKRKLWNANRAKSAFIPLDKVGACWNLLQARRASPAVLPIAQTSADASTFIMLTGCRWSEAAQLQWNCVDLEAKSWHVTDPKNHNPVTFPLAAPAIELLKARRGNDATGYVFAGRGKTPYIKDARRTMEEISKLAGLRITAHDLRRGFIAIGISLKIEMWKLKLLTNHISKGDVTIDHYTETSDLRYLSGEVEQIARWMIKQGRIAASSNVIPLKGAAA